MIEYKKSYTKLNMFQKLEEQEKELKDFKDRIEKANNFIDQVLMYDLNDKDRKKAYFDIENLQDILNNTNWGKIKENK